jgi:hypothetical protein
MKPKNQTQNQGGGSDNNSQSQSATFPKPKTQQPKDFDEKKNSSEEEDIHSDVQPASENRIGKAHTNEEEKMPKPKDNDAWQTGDSRIPENASDNPNS